MAYTEHLDILSGGVDYWNKWRIDFGHIVPDLRGAVLRGRDFSGANFSFANLRKANLRWTNLSKASLVSADLRGTGLSEAKLNCANLAQADLSGALLVKTDFSGANLTGCRVFGTSAWGVVLDNAEQQGLIVTPHNEPSVEVDDLELAQFVYLLLNNRNIRKAINTFTSKVVLILGRFSKERKEVLDSIRARLRELGYVPVMFDFELPRARNLTETVSTLGHLARFIIADISEPRSIPQELMATVPFLPSVPVQPVILATESEWGMFGDFKDWPSLLPTFVYKDKVHLIDSLEADVIGPAEARLRLRSAQGSLH